MENNSKCLKKYLLESIKHYEKNKYILEKFFSMLESNKTIFDDIDKYYNSDADKQYLNLFFLFFFHYQKWINPKNINLSKGSNFFQLQNKESHNKIEKLIIKSFEPKSIKKIFIYWHFYILSVISSYFEDNNNNQSVLIDIENILMQINNKIINFYNSDVIKEKDLFIFTYIYIFWIEEFVKNATHEKNLKLINNILFSLFFDLLEKIAEIIFCEDKNKESNDNIKTFFSFLDIVKKNELLNNDYNIIILLDSNIIQNFMIKILKYINPNFLEKIFPSYITKLAEFFSNFLKFRFNKSKLIDFLLDNIKTGLIDLKYFEAGKEIILNDIFLQNFQSDLIQKVFSNEDKEICSHNFNSFLFNGINSKISFNLSKLNLNDHLVTFSFLIKSNFNSINSYNTIQPLFCFYNEKNECVFKAIIKEEELNETDKGDLKLKKKKNLKFSLIISHDNDEIIIKEFNYLEPNKTYLICFHLNNNFVNLYLCQLTGLNSKIMNYNQEVKFNFKEEKLNLYIGFDNRNNGNSNYFSGYIRYFHFLQLFNSNKEIDYENNKNIIERILSLKQYYKYIIYFLKNPESQNSIFSFDYISHFQNNKETLYYFYILESITKDSQNYYKIILFLSPELFKFYQINKNDNLKDLVIPSISGICEKQKEFSLNDFNITLVRFENSRELFLMKNGLNLFCLEFEYFYQFANYYSLFYNKNEQENKILSELFFDEYKDNSIKLIKSTINNILLILSKYIIDLNITNFLHELKQIFSVLFYTIKSFTNIECIIDSIFHQLVSILIIICEPISLIKDKRNNNFYLDIKSINFFEGFRDSIMDILLTKDFYKNINSKFFESLLDKIILIFENNNSKDINNIFVKALNFIELLDEYFVKFQINIANNNKGIKENKMANSYLKFLRLLIKRNKSKDNDDFFIKQLLKSVLKENSINPNKSYILLYFINDLLNEGFSLEEKEIKDIIKFFNNLNFSDYLQENEKQNICNIVISILIKSIIEKNKKDNFEYFCSEVRNMDLNENLLMHIINEILKIITIYMDEKSIKNIINSDENNFNYNKFFGDLFKFIFIFIKKYFNNRKISISLKQNDKMNDQKESKIGIMINNSLNNQNRIIVEIINLIFFIEEMINAHINNNAIQTTTLFCLLNLIKLLHNLVFDDKLINIFLEQKFMLLFKSIIESCINTKIMYTNYYLNLYIESQSLKSSEYLKTIPEILLDILIKLVKSDLIKIYKEENKIKEYTFTKSDIISFLNKIFMINIKKGAQNDENNKRSLFIYNDLYRYFFSKKIINPENELKIINKNKILIEYFPKFGNEFIYLNSINNLLDGKLKKFDYNFITFNLEKIYRYKSNTDTSEFQDLSKFLELLLIRVIKEHEILYKLNNNDFFNKNAKHSNYNTIKNKIKHILSSKKKLVYIDINNYLELHLENESIPEFIYSGLCETIKESKRNITSKIDLAKTKFDYLSDKEKIKRQMHSSTDLIISQNQIFSPSNKSAKIDEKFTINSSSNSFLSSDNGSVHNEETGGSSDSIPNKSPDSIENINLSSSYNTMSEIHDIKNKNILQSMNSSNSSSSLLTENQTITNIKKNKNLDSSSSTITIVNKSQIEDSINCNFLNELDSMFLFNVKKDLIKNIFSLNFLETIFYDKTFVKLRKIFYQLYEDSLEFPTKSFPTLDYPTKIKNFSNGLEPPFFLNPIKNFYNNKIFPITHGYFNEYMESKNIKFKNENIDLIKKPIFISPKKNEITIYNCELIKINHAIYGTITYSKTGLYLYFEQKDFEKIYNENKNSYDYEGIFSLTSIQFNQKEYMKNKKSKKSNKLYHKKKQLLIFLNDIEEIVERRVLLMWQGVEFYLKDGRSYFFNFLVKRKCQKFLKHLLENEEIKQLFHSKDYLSRNKNIETAWEKDNITNYEYLLFLNKYGGRSFNDPSQYHVFPWIILDFKNLISINKSGQLINEKFKGKNELKIENDKISEEEKKSLQNPLRDLKYPLSLQNESTRNYAVIKYDENCENKFYFHHGTHYSTSAYIFYYLMRQEPYDTLFVKFQNYQLENANRMFIGVKETADILETGNDNRELIPEFFAKIEFLLNLNYSFYGIRTSNKIVNNVNINFLKNSNNSPILLSDYVRFIIEHKNLLNSNLINSKINDWINNIFGIGQFPKEKKKNKTCCNIFRKTTYEEKTDLQKKMNTYKDNKRHKNYKPFEIRLKLMNKANLILSFGQTPYQIFKEAHKNKQVQINDENDSSFLKGDLNGLSYHQKNDLDEITNEETLFSFSKILNSSKDETKTKFPCIYFDINIPSNKIFALSYNHIVEINFEINDENDSNIKLVNNQENFKIPHIKFFEFFNVNDVDYYIYKPKYSFSSFKNYEFIDYASRKDSKISKDSKNRDVNSDKNFNFNNYYKNLFENMYLRKNIDNQFEENHKFIHCRYLDNSFKIYKYIKMKNSKKKLPKNLSFSFSYLCEDFVSSCCTISSNQFIVGLDNGKLIRWNIIKEEKDKLEISFDKNIQAHNGKITAIEIDHRLGLIITCGKDNLVQIRKLYNLELITPIKLKRKYIITMAKVSPANFLYILCFDIKEKKSIIYGYTLTGIKFAKNKGGVYCNIDFTRSGNIVSLLDHKELVILNSYDLRKKENLINQTNYQEDLNELKNIEGASWLEFNYFLKKPNLKDKTRINNVIVYIKRGKNEKDNLIYYYKFKENKIFE